MYYEENYPQNESCKNESSKNENEVSKDSVAQEISKETESESKSSDILLAEQKDYYLRIIADYENKIKRVQLDASRLSDYAIEKFARDLIPLLSAFESAAKDPLISEGSRKGIELIIKNFLDALHKNGISKIHVNIGEDFDSERHQAISSRQETEVEEGKILEIIQHGFSFHNKLIVPAFVITSL